jgi:hypothetical protein
MGSKITRSDKTSFIHTSNAFPLLSHKKVTFPHKQRRIKKEIASNTSKQSVGCAAAFHFGSGEITF